MTLLNSWKTFTLSGLAFLVLLSPTFGLETTEELSFLLFHSRYPLTQDYLEEWSGNPTSDDKHAGYDFGTGTGKTIYAPISGECVNAGGSLGYCSIYNATLDRTVIFLHLSEVYVLNGDQVQIGEVLGKTGSAGASAAHAHIECRSGYRPQAVGDVTQASTASQTMDPLTAFADLSVAGTVRLESLVLDAASNSNWYRIYACAFFNPGELTAILKNYGSLDADLWYSWNGNDWYIFSAQDGNEFRNLTFGSGYGTGSVPLYIAVVAYSGAGTCDFMWHSTQSAP